MMVQDNFRPVSGTGQTLALGAASVPSSPMPAGTFYVRLSATGNCHVSVGKVPIATPVQNAATTSTTGGTLAAGTYFYVVTALTANGETIQSNERSVATTGTTSSNTISWGAVTGATGYRVYRGTAAGAENVYYAPGNVTNFVDTGAASTGGTPPASNTAVTNTASASDMLVKASDPPITLRVQSGEIVAVIQDAASTGNLNLIGVTH